MEPEALFCDPTFAGLYDHMHEPGRADFAFCRVRAANAASVLDIGCGTGELAVELAEGRDVVGLDPAAAMLDVARARPGGGSVRWIEGDARTANVGRRFELVLLTGHVFQCFLTEADRAALFRSLARHLAPGGAAVFDSRNPLSWTRWTPETTERRFPDSSGGLWKRWTSVADDPRPDVIVYTQHFLAPGSAVTQPVAARLAFPTRDRIEAELEAAGLRAAEVYGDWTGADWSEDSPETVVVATLA